MNDRCHHLTCHAAEISWGERGESHVGSGRQLVGVTLNVRGQQLRRKPSSYWSDSFVTTHKEREKRVEEGWRARNPPVSCKVVVLETGPQFFYFP